jgi:hypothetical protein
MWYRVVVPRQRLAEVSASVADVTSATRLVAGGSEPVHGVVLIERLLEQALGLRDLICLF